MGTLYIDRRDIELRAAGRRLEIYEQGRASGSVPIPHLQRVVIHSRAVLDTGVLGALAEHGVGLTVLNQRSLARTAILVGRPHADASRRVAQYRRFLDPAWRDRWAARLVRHKIAAQRRLLRRALEQRPDERLVLTTALRALESRTAALGAGAPRATTRGLEGAAAAAYFQGFTRLFPDALEFRGRNRRPPRDPVNACLSLGYTLLHAEGVLACHAAGLDPYLGFYHEPVHGRESLASDLIEPLRPHVDGWVWQVFRERTLRVEDFTRDKEACLLGKGARQEFYRAWEVPAARLRRLLRRYAGALATALARDGEGLMEPSAEEEVE